MKNKDSNVHKSEALEIRQLNKQTLTLISNLIEEKLVSKWLSFYGS